MVLWHSPDRNSTVSTQANILYNEFEYYTYKITPTSSRGQWVKTIFMCHNRHLITFVSLICAYKVVTLEEFSVESYPWVYRVIYSILSRTGSCSLVNWITTAYFTSGSNRKGRILAQRSCQSATEMSKLIFLSTKISNESYYIGSYWPSYSTDLDNGMVWNIQ